MNTLFVSKKLFVWLLLLVVFTSFSLGGVDLILRLDSLDGVECADINNPCIVNEDEDYTIVGTTPTPGYWTVSDSTLAYLVSPSTTNIAVWHFSMVLEPTVVKIIYNRFGNQASGFFEIQDNIKDAHQGFVINSTFCGVVEGDAILTFGDVQIGHTGSSTWGLFDVGVPNVFGGSSFYINGLGPLTIGNFVNPGVYISNVEANFSMTTSKVITAVDSILLSAPIRSALEGVVVVDDDFRVSGVLSNPNGNTLSFGDKVEVVGGLEVFGLSDLGSVPLMENVEEFRYYYSKFILSSDLPDCSSTFDSTCGANPSLACCIVSFNNPSYYGCSEGIKAYFVSSEDLTSAECKDIVTWGSTGFYIFKRTPVYSTMTVNEDLNIHGDLNASSITLDDKTRSTWPTHDQYGVDNLVLNPGFEFVDFNGYPEDWGVSVIGDFEIVSSGLHGLGWNITDTDGISYAFMLEPVDLTVDSWTASAWVKANSGTRVGLSFRDNCGDTPYVWSEDLFIESSGDWQRLSVTANPVVNTRTGCGNDVQGKIYLSVSDGFAYFDDVQIEHGVDLAKYKPRFLDSWGNAEFANVDVRGNLYSNATVSVGLSANSFNSLSASELKVGVFGGDLLINNKLFVGDVIAENLSASVLNLRGTCEVASNKIRGDGRGLTLSFSSASDCGIGTDCEFDDDCAGSMVCHNGVCGEDCLSVADDDGDGFVNYCDSDCSCPYNYVRIGCYLCTSGCEATSSFVELGGYVDFSLKNVPTHTANCHFVTEFGQDGLINLVRCSDTFRRIFALPYFPVGGVYHSFFRASKQPTGYDYVSCPDVLVTDSPFCTGTTTLSCEDKWTYNYANCVAHKASEAGGCFWDSNTCRPSTNIDCSLLSTDYCLDYSGCVINQI
ncbi:MAG: hypothetical protein KKF89_04190 [Nanoarchaeota archaeon]|nr:hypothetical protein [Nanoarchaeota archaeon]